MILLTGGAGFIGSHVLTELNNRGYDDIVIIDEAGESKWQNLVGKSFRAYYSVTEFYGNLASPRHTFPAAVCPKPEIIIHLGAEVNTQNFDFDMMMSMNFNPSVRLAHFATNYNARFIFASSAAIYGDGSASFDDSSIRDAPFNVALGPKNLTTQNIARSPYAISKQLVEDHCRRSAMPENWVIFRLFNVYGLNEFHKNESASIIHQWLTQPIISKHVPLRLFRSNNEKYIDGGQKRDFICVSDVARVIVNAAINPPIVSGVYNLGTGQPRSFNEVAAFILKNRGLDNPLSDELVLSEYIDYISMPKELSSCFQNYTKAKMTKLNNAMDVGDIVPLGHGIKRLAKQLKKRGDLGRDITQKITSAEKDLFERDRMASEL